jgi:hypothetical protein
MEVIHAAVPRDHLRWKSVRLRRPHGGSFDQVVRLPVVPRHIIEDGH